MRRRRLKHPKITPELIAPRTWYALKVQSRSEFVAQDTLSQRGLLTYVPVKKVWRWRNKYARMRNDPKDLVSYAEIPGYVFVGFSAGQIIVDNIPEWFSIFEIPTIRGAVGVGGCPMAVDQEGLVNLAETFPNGLHKPDREAFMRTYREFGEGDDVVICNGPFEGCVVPVLEIRDDKTLIELDLFGRKTRPMYFATIDLEKHVS